MASGTKSTSTYASRELRFIIEDDRTRAYVHIVCESGDLPIGVAGWHYKDFAAGLPVQAIVQGMGSDDPIDWPMGAPPLDGALPNWPVQVNGQRHVVHDGPAIGYKDIVRLAIGHEPTAEELKLPCSFLDPMVGAGGELRAGQFYLLTPEVRFTVAVPTAKG